MIDIEYVKKTFPEVIKYIPVTFNLTIGALLIAIPFALLFSLILNKKVPVLTQIIKTYISLIRGTPLLLQIYIMYNRGPLILNGLVKALGLNLDVYAIDYIWYAYFVLSLSATVSLTDAFKSAIVAVDKGQFEAAYSVGLSNFNTYKNIVLPQAIAVAIPVVGNTVIGAIKGSSLAFAMAVIEVTGIAKVLAGASMKYLEAYLEIFIIYIVIIVFTEWVFKLLEKKATKFKVVL